jgi:hypothetical protein
MVRGHQPLDGVGILMLESLIKSGRSLVDGSNGFGIPGFAGEMTAKRESISETTAADVFTLRSIALVSCPARDATLATPRTGPQFVSWP